jgi:hypothetical protein
MMQQCSDTPLTPPRFGRSTNWRRSHSNWWSYLLAALFPKLSLYANRSGITENSERPHFHHWPCERARRCHWQLALSTRVLELHLNYHIMSITHLTSLSQLKGILSKSSDKLTVSFLLKNVPKYPNAPPFRLLTSMRHGESFSCSATQVFNDGSKVWTVSRYCSVLRITLKTIH